MQVLVPDMLPAQRVQAFRQIILDAIERFHLRRRMDFHSRQARTYNILLLRYVEGHESQDVVQQLALSERQFYWEHRRTLQALSQILWEHSQRSKIVPENSSHDALSDYVWEDNT